MKFIIDTDPGHDDLIAIALAQRLGEITLVTSVSGNAPLDQTTTNALVSADLVGYSGPVIAGADRPRSRKPYYPTVVHGETGLDGAVRPQPSRAATPGDAVDALLRAADGETWLVAIGPLTNVAAALDRDPSFAKRLAGITIMGGAIAMGNASAVAEFNVWTDPEAADVVFQSGAPIVMCGLDLTTQLRYDEQWVASLQNRYVAALLGHYLANHRYLERAGAPLHDPCAVLAVTHPHLFEFGDYPVAVECDSKLTRGMTVVDRRPWAEGPTVSVALTIDAAGALSLIADAINDLAQVDEP